MAVATFSFHAELNHFIPQDKKNVKITHFFTERASIKDTIESLGIPHPEVDCIEVNDTYVDFSYIVQDGDVVNVYPISVAPETAIVSVRPKPLSVVSFVLDIHLGKLASSLRLLGFDTLYRNDYPDEELAYVSSTENRILLTRDKGLLMRGIVTYGYYVRSTNPQLQVPEVMRRFDLYQLVTPFQRCIRCNGLLAPTPKENVVDLLPESVRLLNNEFHQCQSCGQVYWKGSHYERLQKFVEGIMNDG